MAMSVTYTTFNGQIVYENRGGVESYYAPDTLGSTAALLNASGVVTDTFTYQPYGEIASHVGSSVTPFTYCGTLGYYTDTANSSIYVRARYYRPNLARWQTVDPLWPRESQYVYAFTNPAMYSDRSGLEPQWSMNTNPGKYPVYSPCGTCASAIVDKWFPHPAHGADHQYAHCMACCVLNALGGTDCAFGTQTNQNLVDVWPPNGRVGRMHGRYDNCLDGIGVRVMPPLSISESCQRGCQAAHPLPPGIPPFPPLPECDPTNYQKRRCPAGSWNYIVP